MKVLLLGSGGRECALAWKLAKSKKLRKLWILPGNAGTRLYGTNVCCSETDFDSIKQFVIKNAIDLVIVGPESLLARGIADFFTSDEDLKQIKVIGPHKKGASLESSKVFAKAFMKQYNIPTASYRAFNTSNIEEAYKYLESLSPPYVLKADGLAAGKGVVIYQYLLEAKKGLHEMLIGKKFGKASEKVIIEEFLHGVELSVFILSDGNNYVLLPSAKDYKRIGEGDTGPNTGGMGSVSPVKFAGNDFMNKVEEKIIKPTINGLKKEEIDYCGFIFFGLMNCQGEPYVIEYNVRLGDPETEAIIPRIENDLLEVFQKTAEGKLHEINLKISEKYAVTVMLVAAGYPGNYEKGMVIRGLGFYSDCEVFHAGTMQGDDGKIYTNGGRVLAITGLGETLESALRNAYNAANKIEFDGKNYRNDIGNDLRGFI